MANVPKGISLGPESTGAPNGKNHLLVIAVDEYLYCPRLNNCVKDAQDFVAVLLEKYQFEPQNVLTLYNAEASRANIHSKLKTLRKRVRPEDNLILYFSGHGETEDDMGYWVPVEAHSTSEWEFVSTSEIRARLDVIHSFHTFVIVDACFSGALFSIYRSVRPGYENKRSRWGLAASHSRERALDGTPGENSPFATTLLHQLKGSHDNLSIQELAAAVIRRVERATEGRQTPVFKPLNVKGDDEGQYVFHLKANEAADWKACQEAGTVAAYQAFLAKYPEGMYTQAAKATLAELEEEAAWEEAKAANTILSYYQYNQRYPSGKYRADALAAIKQLEEEQTWRNAQRAGSLSAFLEYKERYPQGRFTAEAEKQIKAILARQQEPAAWQAAKGKDTLAAYEAYLQEYSQGAHALEARAAIQELNRQAAEEQAQEEKRAREQQRKQEEEKQREQKAADESRRQEAQRKPAAQAGPATEVHTDQFAHRPEPAFDWKKWGPAGAGILVVVLVIWGISQWAGGGSTSADTPKESTAITKNDTQQDGKTGGKPPSTKTGSVSFGERTYKTVTLNGKTWLAENLDIEIPGKSWYHDDLKPSEREKYGRLYTWQAAQDACEELGPKWWLPRDEEWSALREKYGGATGAYQALIESRSTEFAALLGGWRYPNGSFNLLGVYGGYWSGTEKDTQGAWVYYFFSSNGELYRYAFDKSFGFSCRCLQD
ncbi:MAG: caspase family protein [Phaeodactylibacter sp.]|nr:caspase family protein [Phaeodactylibacter sp.]